MAKMNTNNTFKFLTKHGDNYVCWCTVEGMFNTLFRDFSQFILDGCNNPSAYILYEVENNMAWDFCKVTEWLEMRKRTPEEIHKKTQTGIWAKCE